MKKLILFILLCPLLSCTQPCDKLPAHYDSWSEAVTTIARAQYQTKDFMSCDKSSWIQSAYFYSCDGVTGYMIMNTKSKRSYLHKGVPVELWNRFKVASSYGAFYNYFLKHKYQFIL